MQKKRIGIRLSALLMAACLGLSGCSLLPDREASGIDEPDLPEPTEEEENMILGETMYSQSAHVTLYYAMADGTSYTSITHHIRVPSNRTAVDIAVTELLGVPLTNARIYAFPADTQLISTELTNGIATVNLSIDARNTQNEMELLALITSIGNTLLSLPNVYGVNVLIGSQSEAVCRLPYGIQTQIVQSLTAEYAQLQAERDHFLAGDGMSIRRSAALYFPSRDGWIVPEMADITFEDDDYVSALIKALDAYIPTCSCINRLFPTDADLLEDEPSIVCHPDGRQILELNLSSALKNYISETSQELWQLAGSISMTMCSFIPGLDGVRLMVDHVPISLNANPDDSFGRMDFSDRIGTIVTLYMVDNQSENGDLIPLDCAVSQKAAFSPRLMLQLLFEYANANAEGVGLPIGYIQREDLLGVQVSNRIARINLSGAFYHAAQALNPGQERLLIYSIVNTLCALDSVDAVRFYVEGIAAETLSGSIYLKSPLIANPGLIHKEKPAKEDTDYEAEDTGE